MSHYFMNDKNLKNNKKNIKIYMFNNEFTFKTNNGVFSKNHLDYGTKLLLENINVNNLKGNILDLGCGIGIIGIIIAKMNKMVKVDMIDINERAIELSKENNLLNNTNNNIFISDIYQNVPSKYDFIITNPPIRAGKEVLKEMLIGSFEHLNEKGILYFVMRKDHGVKSMIAILEKMFKVETIKKDKGFYIIKCSK